MIDTFCITIDTAVSDIEDSFRSFTSRSDIAIILINQNVSIDILHIQIHVLLLIYTNPGITELSTRIKV